MHPDTKSRFAKTSRLESSPKVPRHRPGRARRRRLARVAWRIARVPIVGLAIAVSIPATVVGWICEGLIWLVETGDARWMPPRPDIGD